MIFKADSQLLHEGIDRGRLIGINPIEKRRICHTTDDLTDRDASTHYEKWDV